MYQTGFDKESTPSDFEHGTIYFTIEPKIKFKDLFFCFSSSFYFKEVRIDNRYKQFLLNFGIGINLF